MLNMSQFGDRLMLSSFSMFIDDNRFDLFNGMFYSLNQTMNEQLRQLTEPNSSRTRLLFVHADAAAMSEACAYDIRLINTETTACLYVFAYVKCKYNCVCSHLYRKKRTSASSWVAKPNTAI